MKNNSNDNIIKQYGCALVNVREGLSYIDAGKWGITLVELIEQIQKAII